MRSNTALLKSRLKNVSDIDEKLAMLKDSYSGETCYLLTCGPSFKNHDLEKLRSILKDKLVFSVKQTFDGLSDLVDFHLLNSWNYKVYDYSRSNAIVLMERTPKDPETPGLNADLVFPIDGVDSSIPREIRLENRLAQKQNFEDYLFENNVGRPWGPGVVYELGIYLAVHIGVSGIVALGWDIGELNTKKMEHFYDSDAPQVLADKATNLLKSDGEISLEDLKKVYNEPGFVDGEVKLIADSTKELFSWLTGKGVALEVASDRSLIHPDVPRVEL